MLSEEMWVRCKCQSDAHILCLSRDVYPDEPEPEVSLQPFLYMHNSFLRRIWVALCYIFKWHENLGQFDSIVIEKENAQRIIKFLNDSFPEEQVAVKPIIMFRERLKTNGNKTIFDVAAEKYASVLNCEKPNFDANKYFQNEKSTYYYFPLGIVQLVRLSYYEFDMFILSRT